MRYEYRVRFKFHGRWKPYGKLASKIYRRRSTAVEHATERYYSRDPNECHIVKANEDGKPLYPYASCSGHIVGVDRRPVMDWEPTDELGDFSANLEAMTS